MSTGQKKLDFFFNLQISPKLNDECRFNPMKLLPLGHFGAFDIGVEKA